LRQIIRTSPLSFE